MQIIMSKLEGTKNYHEKKKKKSNNIISFKLFFRKNMDIVCQDTAVLLVLLFSRRLVFHHESPVHPFKNLEGVAQAWRMDGQKIRKEILVSYIGLQSKLDGVGPVDNRPYTNRLHHFVWKKTKKTCDIWHVTHDTDMWHVTRDMWHVTCCGGWTFSQNFSSLDLTVCDLWYYEDLEEMADLIT